MLENFNYNLVQKNDSLLLAVSGGIDSMVLLDILNKMKVKLNLKLYIAHVDHQTRNSSKDDRDFVLEQAQDLGVEVFLESLQLQETENFHDYAHKARYDFFYKIAKENQIKKIVLAHNSNDLAETILMRITRGSSFEGYRGILEDTYYKDIRVIRPMLKMSRNDIEVYQQANLIPYQNDPSNASDDYTRNRFRHHLMPLLEEENPKYLEKINQFSFYQTLSYKMIEQETMNYLSKININENTSIDLVNFKELPKIIKIEAIKRIVNEITENSLELSLTNILDILELSTKKKPHLSFIIEDKLYVEKSYDKLSFKTKNEPLSNFLVVAEGFQEIELPNDYLISITKKPNKNYGFIYKLWYNNLDLVFPLTIRNRTFGDKIKTQIGTKKLKDVFIDKKIPIKERDTLPIVINKNREIIFVPGIFSKESTGDNLVYILVKKGK